ncbi:hypothetical protein [Algibacter sp. 2305UL17-15]|uniref:hypothetical protein n=1 Tax=Algibacter sp. 2305UL17-15 TaxID=3231268 RepID=UPI00345879A4
MNSLKAENIEFIDNYLKNSGVQFVDVRLEMIDHVASEIEAKINDGNKSGFYNIFKNYMILNKSNLLKTNAKYYRIVDKKIFRHFLRKALSLHGVFISVIIILSWSFLERILDKSQMDYFLSNAPLWIIISFSVIYFVIVWRRKNRYSALERIGFYIMILGQIVNFSLYKRDFSILSDANNYLFMKLSVSALVFSLIILTFSVLEFKKSYQLKYETIN